MEVDAPAVHERTPSTAFAQGRDRLDEGDDLRLLGLIRDFSERPSGSLVEGDPVVAVVGIRREG